MEFLLNIEPALWAIITATLIYVARIAIIFLKGKTTLEDRAVILDVIKGVVMFVEQVTKKDVAFIGQRKFELAKETIILLLNEKGFTITEAELEVLIERFVLEIKGVE